MINIELNDILYSIRRNPFTNKPRDVRKCTVVRIEEDKIWCKFSGSHILESFDEKDFGSCIFHTREDADKNF